MEYFRFTLFNDLTLLLLALTIASLVWRVRARLRAGWPLAFYAVALGHSLGFAGGVNPYAVTAGLFGAIGQRFEVIWKPARVLELAALAYIAWRSTGLLLLWPACAPFCAW